jgi:RND family efflux transporter MFP subunit
MSRLHIVDQEQPTLFEENSEGVLEEASTLHAERWPKRWIAATLGAGLAGICLGVVLAQTPGEKTKTGSAPQGSSMRSASRIYAEGRLVTRPGSEVTLSTETGGTLAQLLFHEGDEVKQGALLGTFASGEERAALTAAQGRLSEAKAEWGFQQAELHRHKVLRADHAESASVFDRARRDADAAGARFITAQAEVQRLSAHLKKLTLTSPLAGSVIGHFTEAGETLAPGAKVLTLADLNALEVEAEVDEYDVGKLQVGAPVSVKAEGFGERQWTGQVREIPATVTTRRLKPLDSSRPSDIRVLLVRVAVQDPAPLKLGQRVEVEVDASSATPTLAPAR